MMRVPGANVLNTAFSILSKSQLLYYAYVGRILNAVGQYVTQYADATVILGSFQPVPRSKYTYLGLDLQKSYFYLYISKAILDLNRDISADQLGFQGERYQIQSNVKWLGIDGWLEILCVAIGTDLAQSNIFGFNQPSNFSDGNFAGNSNTQEPPNVG